MSNKVLPRVDQIALPETHHQEVGRRAVKSLLMGFQEVPEERRADLLMKLMLDRTALVTALRAAMVKDFVMLGRPEKDHDGLLAIAENVIDPVFKALLEVYPTQH
jgi:hypothetical protein